MFAQLCAKKSSEVKFLIASDVQGGSDAMLSNGPVSDYPQMVGWSRQGDGFSRSETGLSKVKMLMQGVCPLYAFSGLLTSNSIFKWGYDVGALRQDSTEDLVCTDK